MIAQAVGPALPSVGEWMARAMPIVLLVLVLVVAAYQWLMRPADPRTVRPAGYDPGDPYRDGGRPACPCPCHLGVEPWPVCGYCGQVYYPDPPEANESCDERPGRRCAPDWARCGCCHCNPTGSFWLHGAGADDDERRPT